MWIKISFFFVRCTNLYCCAFQFNRPIIERLYNRFFCCCCCCCIYMYILRSLVSIFLPSGNVVCVGRLSKKCCRQNFIIDKILVVEQSFEYVFCPLLNIHFLFPKNMLKWDQFMVTKRTLTRLHSYSILNYVVRFVQRNFCWNNLLFFF